MSDLREMVARAKYEEKRARLLEAFGDTSGWPEWEALRPTLKEIEMEECDFYIALCMEEAAQCAESASFQFTHTPSTVEVVDVRHTIAAAIRALAQK